MYPLQRPKIGFVIQNTTASELALSLLLGSSEVSADIDVQLYFVQMSRHCINTQCAAFHYTEAFSFDGPLVVTDLDTALKVVDYPFPCKKYFFVNDLEWLYYPIKQYEFFAQVYRNSKFELIARCNDHKLLLEKCWNVKVPKVIERYDFFKKENIDYLMKEARYLYDDMPKHLDLSIINSNSLQL